VSVSGLSSEFANFSGSEEPLGSLAQNWQVFAIILVVFTGIFLFKFGRKGFAANAQPRDSGLGARLAEIDLENYDLDGTKPAEPAPAANFDDFFSNAERREELTRDKPAPAPDPVLFDVPTLADLPARDPHEPEVSPEACQQLVQFVIDAEDRRKLDPDYKFTAKEKFASRATRADEMCGEGFCHYLKEAPHRDRFVAIRKMAHDIGAPDLEAIIDLQIQALDQTATAEWRDLNPGDEEGWSPAIRTAGALGALFDQANQKHRSQSRFRTLAADYLFGQR